MADGSRVGGRALKVVVQQVTFRDEVEAFFFEGPHGEIDIVDVEGDGSLPIAIEEGVGVLDVDLGLEQGDADLEVGLRVLGEFDSDEVDFGEGELGEFEDFAAPIGVVHNEADDGAIDRVGDAEGDDADLVAFEVPQERMEAADAVFDKDRELAEGGPGAGAGGDFRRALSTGSLIVLLIIPFFGRHEPSPASRLQTAPVGRRDRVQCCDRRGIPTGPHEQST